MSKQRLHVSGWAAICILGSAICAAGQNGVPAGWHKLGAAAWRTENGVIVGTPEQESGGWLVLDRGYQDVQVSASFQCSGAARSGILLRAEKTAAGVKGVYLSLVQGDISAYNVVLDAQGKEISRGRLGPYPGNMIRMAAARLRGPWDRVPGFSKLGPLPPEVPQAVPPPWPGGPKLSANDWNTVEITLDADILAANVNRWWHAAAGTTVDDMMGFGPLALYAGGKGEVRFKEVSYKDLNPKFEPAEQVSPHFRMQRISDFFYGWCAAAADINRDGVLDVVSGPFYYLGPTYTERREFTAARTYNPSNQLPQPAINFAYDFTGDGWPDILMTDVRPIYLYVNPRGESRRWDRYEVVSQSAMEIFLLKDIDGDGKPEVIFGGDGAMQYAKPDPANPTAPWIAHRISGEIKVNPHGIGVGDINGDGRMDLVAASGWWEQPTEGAAQSPWKFHAVNFGNGGAEMGVYDVNGDGRNDVVTALAVHGWGLAWFEQKRDRDGNITFVRHDIMGDPSARNAGDVVFSEPHGATFADVDGDGIPDIITGKRHWSHLESYTDPDPYGPAVLYWYRTVRNPKAEGGAEFVPELIHNRSGVGSHLAAVDLDHDGAVDIITSANRGTFIFWNQVHRGRAGAAVK